MLSSHSSFTPSLLDTGKALILPEAVGCALLLALPAEEGHLNIARTQYENGSTAFRQQLQSVAKLTLMKKKAIRDFAFCRYSSNGSNNSAKSSVSQEGIYLCTLTATDIEIWSYLPHSVDKLRLQASYSLEFTAATTAKAIGNPSPSGSLLLRQLLAISGLEPQLLFTSIKGQLYSLQLKNVLSSPSPIAGSAADLLLLPLAKPVQLLSQTSNGDVMVMYADDSLCIYTVSGLLHMSSADKANRNRGTSSKLFGEEEDRQQHVAKAMVSCSDFAISIYAPKNSSFLAPSTLMSSSTALGESSSPQVGFKHVFPGTSLSDALYVPHANSLESKLLMKQKVSSESIILTNHRHPEQATLDIPTLSIKQVGAGLLSNLLSMNESNNSSGDVTSKNLHPAIVEKKQSSLRMKVLLPKVDEMPSTASTTVTAIEQRFLEKVQLAGQQTKQQESLQESLKDLCKEFQFSHQHQENFHVVFESEIIDSSLISADILASQEISDNEMVLAIASSVENKVALFYLRIIGKEKCARLIEVVELPNECCCRGLLFLAPGTSRPQSALESLSFRSREKDHTLPTLLCMTSCKHVSPGTKDGNKGAGINPLVSISTNKTVDIQLSLVHCKNKIPSATKSQLSKKIDDDISATGSFRQESDITAVNTPSTTNVDTEIARNPGQSKLDVILASIEKLANRFEVCFSFITK